MSSQQTVLQVVILRDGLLVGTEVFTPGSYVLGSAPASDLRLDDASVAPRHAVLYFQNGRAAIQDSGSNAGVYVNGHRVSACEVRSTDEVLCGPFVLKTRVLAQRPRDERPQPPPEVAALLGAAPPPAAPPQAQVPVAAPVPPAPTAQQLAATQPIARFSGAVKPVAPVPSPPPAVTVAVTRPAPPSPAQLASTTVYGAGAGATPARATPPPAVPLPDTVPAATMPSTRRRAAPQPVQATGPALVLADDVLADLPEEPQPPRAQAPDTRMQWEQAAAPLDRPTHAPRLEPGRGPAQLYLELYWGAVRRDARRFAPGKKVQAAADEQAPMPLWGFQLPDEPFTLAESANDAFRLYVPKGAQVERTGPGGRYERVAPNALEADGERRFVTLRQGTAARLSEGKMSLVAYAAPLPEKVRVNPLKGLPWLAIGCFLFFSSALGSFIAFMPKRPEGADFTQKNLPPVALRLLAPEPKKKEEAKKKLESIKEKAKKQVAKKDTPTPVAPQPPPPKQEKPQPTPKAVAAAPESKALKALAKLSAAGPATKDLLAAVDKLGSGPGSKNVKNSNFKLSGLIGKAPIANAGLGTFGLGGGGKGGGATLGAEILRGKGGGGIGALGAGGVGKGKVGGTVARASARTIAAQGSIDREAVAKVVNSHLQEVYACYERALLKEPGLAGKVVLEWTIGTNGRVVATKTKSSTLRSPSVESCIMGGLKGWTFPPAKGGAVIITYPFIFNSVGY
ncbi:AgmX/PglI C-terminal domain-containing protein [Archangium lipolyticum]|uniref:AgmX/PglI C-terminal domain-containing protein n=1 Tax=Archangium lipolyticum TaxID=2970465 RepID=UPI00214A1B7D|nr:AgmX/PglI C-terminal domain-containing protein [Archangium lipolyticum]